MLVDTNCRLQSTLIINYTESYRNTNAAQITHRKNLSWPLYKGTKTPSAPQPATPRSQWADTEHNVLMLWLIGVCILIQYTVHYINMHQYMYINIQYMCFYIKPFSCLLNTLCFFSESNNWSVIVLITSNVLSVIIILVLVGVILTNRKGQFDYYFLL